MLTIANAEGISTFVEHSLPMASGIPCWVLQRGTNFVPHILPSDVTGDYAFINPILHADAAALPTELQVALFENRFCS